jgi:hypothetical protein
MAKVKVYLVIGADKRVRAAKRPQVKPDEVAIAVNLVFPDHWGKVIDTIDVAVPDWVPDVRDLDDSAARHG